MENSQMIKKLIFEMKNSLFVFDKDGKEMCRPFIQPGSNITFESRVGSFTNLIKPNEMPLPKVSIAWNY